MLDVIPAGPVCVWCEGAGKVERFVVSMRRRAKVDCGHCAGTGRTGEPIRLLRSEP